MAVERKFNLKACPFCKRSNYFTGVQVEVKPDVKMWYITCHYERGGCGAASGWYTGLESIPEDFEIVDDLDFGHPKHDDHKPNG